MYALERLSLVLLIFIGWKVYMYKRGEETARQMWVEEYFSTSHNNQHNQSLNFTFLRMQLRNTLYCA